MSNDHVAKNHQNQNHNQNQNQNQIQNHSQQPNARLCHIKKWDHFDGYGFNLHAEKGKLGQYIGKVDEGSPSEAAGLKQGDRILEVNGENIANKTHKQVVELIKTYADETKLLVVDPHDDANGNGNANCNGTGTGIGTGTVVDHADGKDAEHQANGSSNNDVAKGEREDRSERADRADRAETAERAENGMLNLSMTAAELRAKLAAKKKFDPKKEAMDFKQKFDIVQKL